MTRTPATDHAAARLALHRIATGMPVDTVATQLGVSRAALYRYEDGEVLKVATVQSIADLLGITLIEALSPLTEQERAVVAALPTGVARGKAHDRLSWFGLLEPVA